MTPLDLPLTPAQWEHYDQHGWTLVPAPMTECRNTLHDLRDAPVSEYHCPECGRAPYRSKDDDWYCFDPKGESACRWRGPNPKVTPCCVPVPATVPCPGGWDLLQGPSNSPKRVHHDLSGKPCPTCSGSGVVPRTVGVVRPEVVTLDPKSPLYPLGSLPAGRVGTATVTPVPVVDVGDAPPDVPHVVVSGVTGTVWWCGGKRVESGRGSTVWTDVQQVQVLFATPPNPGTTVWRLDRNEER